MNVPAMLMQMTNSLFMDMLDNVVVVFLDNVLIYSTIMKEYFELLEKVFARLGKHAFYCNLKKYSFLQRTTIFLGFNITPKVLKTSDSKVKSLNR